MGSKLSGRDRLGIDWTLSPAADLPNKNHLLGRLGGLAGEAAAFGSGQDPMG